MNALRHVTIALAGAGLLAVAPPAGAATISFNDWTGSGVVNDNSTSETATLSQDGVTFTMSIVSDPDNVFANADKLGVRGGNGAARLDERDAGTADDESITLNLSVSGAALSSISIDSLTFSFFAGDGEQVEFQDGSSNSIGFGANTLAYDYTGSGGNNQLTGLDALALSNVGGQGDGSWELKVIARDSIGGTKTDFAIDEVNIAYEVAIPEPATTLLLGIAIVAGLPRRRRKSRACQR